MNENNFYNPANSDTLLSLNCQEVSNRFPEYLDGELTLESHARFEHHLTTCPSCRESFAAYKLVVDCAADLGKQDAVKPLEIGVQNRLRKALNQRLGTKLSYIV